VLLAPPASAAHCRHGLIYRVSRGVCVSKASRAARGFVRRTTTKHHESPRDYYVEILIPAGRGATPRVPGITDVTTPRSP
jgi:hypothetical protein